MDADRRKEGATGTDGGRPRPGLATGEVPLLTVAVRSEHDAVLAHQRARHVARLLGLELSEQTRLATAVAEVARNAHQHAGGGTVTFSIAPGSEVGPRRAARRTDEPGHHLVVRVVDRGPGMRDRAGASGAAAPASAPGDASVAGLVGARRLIDRLDVESVDGGGTMVEMAKALPRQHEPLTPERVGRLAAELARVAPSTAFEEVRQQNAALLQALDELRARQAEIARMNGELASANERLADANRELEETNRGVVALYAELDERASYLERLSEAKTRWLSRLSHELRTPLNAVRNLSVLLLDGIQGELTPPQREPVALIRDSADQLRELVDDWLDLAKIEAGKTTVRPTQFTASELLAALRGMFRPLATSSDVVLTVEEPPAELPPLVSDEAKVAQILRNFVSNALKFTVRGTVRVWASAGEGDVLRFAVSDTGVGIAPEDHARVFEEFSQLEHPIQRQVKGTGLGLPLSRQLARLLGGDIELESEPGVGSTFTLVLPRRYAPQDGAPAVGAGGAHV